MIIELKQLQIDHVILIYHSLQNIGLLMRTVIQLRLAANNFLLIRK